MPTALTYTYATEADIQAFYGVTGTTATVDDDSTNSQSATEADYITSARMWATDRCNYYLLPRYTAALLSTSWVVNQWCVIMTLDWLSKRRGNPSPGSVKELVEGAVKDMEAVHDGRYEVPGIGTRSSQWPKWSNVRVDVLYNLRKIRVERPISEGHGLREGQHNDFGAERIWEPL